MSNTIFINTNEAFPYSSLYTVLIYTVMLTTYQLYHIIYHKIQSEVLIVNQLTCAYVKYIT